MMLVGCEWDWMGVIGAERGWVGVSVAGWV